LKEALGLSTLLSSMMQMPPLPHPLFMKRALITHKDGMTVMVQYMTVSGMQRITTVIAMEMIIKI